MLCVNLVSLQDRIMYIKSDDEEILDMLATRSPQMKKAVGVLKELSADEATRMRYENLENARRDIVSRINAAEKAKVIEIAKNALKMNLPIEDIITLTGLTRVDIELLRDAE